MKNCTESLQQTGHVPAELTEGLDCMVFGVLSWGHNTVQNLPRFQRDTAASSGQEISINTKAADFIMNLSEHPLRFTCHHFWLGTTDETWHRPIQVYIRSKNSVRVKKNVNKIKANLERRGIHFDASRHPSPTDAEVGFRQRPINMLTIHSHGSKEVLTSDQPEEQQGTYRGWPSSSWYGGSSSSKAWWREQWLQWASEYRMHFWTKDSHLAKKKRDSWVPLHVFVWLTPYVESIFSPCSFCHISKHNVCS